MTIIRKVEAKQEYSSLKPGDCFECDGIFVVVDEKCCTYGTHKAVSLNNGILCYFEKSARVRIVQALLTVE